ncbi:MAG: hypothetical protein Q9227_008600 [Pyrenula ochraceoflavens]
MHAARGSQQRLLQQLPHFLQTLRRPTRSFKTQNEHSHPLRSRQNQLQTRSLFTQSSLHHPHPPCQSFRRRPFHRFQSTNTSSSSSSSSSSTGTPSLSARLKKLSREYGWSAVGIYFALSALDFPFCFLAVRWLGTERIGRWEHWVLHNVKRLVQMPLGLGAQEKIDEAGQEVKGQILQPAEGGAGQGGGGGDGVRVLEEEEEGPDGAVWDHGVEEAERANQGDNASIWTQLALAYAIHKSFIFLRVPLTAAVTPKVVKTLRGWGWDIGKRRPKQVVSGTGVNAEKTGVNTGKR